MRGCPGVDRVESEQALDGGQIILPGSGINSLNLEMSDGEIQAGADSRVAVTAIAGRRATTRYGADDGSVGRQHGERVRNQGQ